MVIDERTVRCWRDRVRSVLAQRILQLMHADLPGGAHDAAH
jgi:hypothetical protein